MEAFPKEISDLAKQGYSKIPVAKEISSDTITPVIAYLRLRRQNQQGFLLESAEGGEQVGRYSFLGVQPFLRVSCQEGILTEEDLMTGESIFRKAVTPLNELNSILRRYHAPKLPSLPPFQGGAVGYVSYEGIRYLEKIPIQPQGTGASDFNLMFFDSAICFDRLRHRLHVVTHMDSNSGTLKKEYDNALARIDEILGFLVNPGNDPDPLELSQGNSFGEISDLSALLGSDAYQAGVKKIKHHIRQGDIFQAVLADRFSFPFAEDPFLVYRVLRFVNPSPYLFFLDFDNETLLGSSPEMLARCQSRLIETCPIAGTRPRSSDEKRDRKYEKELLASRKEKAEHLMLVDLGRNDVGRVAKIGSVSVKDYMQVERYSHVMHLVSRVQGTLRAGLTPWDAFTSCFPAGTLSGAPKIRAMEILAQLEPQRRGTYGGAVVCYDFSGNLNSCITIRSLFVKNGLGHIAAGAGIVADSKPQAEYQEVLNKAAAMKKAIVLARSYEGQKI